MQLAILFWLWCGRLCYGKDISPYRYSLPPCLSSNSYMLTVLLMTSLSHVAEQNLKDSTITPHEDKKYAATA